MARDQRISTHCGLVARALGADKIIYSGDQDSGMIKNIDDITSRWGSSFAAQYEKNWKKIVEEYKQKKFSIIHLSMYGQPVQGRIKALRKKTNLLVVVGGEKVPPDIYQIADENIAVGNQPHSEVAALAVFLHEYFAGKELEKKFAGAKLKIIPQDKGKKIEESD